MDFEAGTPVREGDVIAGKYRIERILGKGGMGVVVAAVHVALKQQVAVKFLLPSALSGADTVARFVREAQAAARIQSEHVARVLDVATLENGMPYMVMEYLDGRDLSQLLAARGPLPFEEAVGYILQACEGVAEAHAAGIIHRDIKPSNLFVCERGAGRSIVKVLDFGISKSRDAAFGAGEASLTKSSTVMGSPLYMSPEQMTSAKHVDVRTDIWSLGVALFELLSGKTPFMGDSMTELVAAVLQRDPISVSDLRPDLPSEFVAALGRSLEKDRERRYANVVQFATAIAPFGPRYAALSVERISDALAGSTHPVQPGGSNPPARNATSSGSLAYDRTAAAASGSTSGVGNTTGQPVSNDPASFAGRASGRRTGAILAGVVGALLAVGVAGALVVKLVRPRGESGHISEPAVPPTTQPPPAIEPPSATAATVATAIPAPVVAPEPSTLPTAVASGAGAAPSPAPARHPGQGHPVPVASPPTATAAKTAAVPTTAPSAGPAPTCHVVQYFDADGETRFKKECQ